MGKEKLLPGFEWEARAYVLMFHIFTHPKVFGGRKGAWQIMSRICLWVANDNFDRVCECWQVIEEAAAKRRETKA